MKYSLTALLLLASIQNAYAGHHPPAEAEASTNFWPAVVIVGVVIVIGLIIERKSKK